MKILLFGATGMVGAGALLECLADPRVESVLAIGRSPTGRTHPKLREVIHTDFFAYDALRADFATSDACFFCLDVSPVGMSEAAYSRLTYDLTLAAAQAMVAVNPRLTFCYISGVGTDSSEQGRTMWARVKGRTENALLAPLYPVLHRLFPQASTTTANLGRALIQVAAVGYSKPILYSRDMNALAITP